MIRPGLKIGGRALGTEWLVALVEVVVDREVNITSRAEVRFLDPDLVLFAEVNVGDDLVVSATESGGSSTVIFTGEVVALEVEQVSPGADRELVITAFDLSHRLAHQQQAKPFVKTSVDKIVSAVAADAKVPVGSVQSGPQVEYHPGRRTGLQVLEELCGAYDMEWWVGPDGKLQVGDEPKPTPGASSSVRYDYRDELVQFSVRVAGFAPDRVSAPLWDRSQQKGSQEASSAKQATGSLAKKVAGAKWRKPYVLADDERSLDAKEAKARATGYERRRVAETVVTTGRLAFCDPRLQVGTEVKVDASGTLGGAYVVTSVRHILSRDASRTDFGTGRVRPAGIVDLAGPADDPPPPPPLAVGTVTKVLPKSKDTAGLGPVAVVKYAQLDTGYETCEARLLALGGSKEHGFFVPPSVGDEVLIGYERGDLRYPVVLGGLHSDKQLAGPIAKGDEVNTVRLRDAKGNELVFTLDKEQGTVRLGRAGGELDEVVMDKDRVVVRADKELVLEVGESSITMKKDGTIAIEGKDITVKAKGNVKSESMGDTTIEATKSATLKAKGGPLLAEGIKVDVKGSGPVAVKGAIVQIN